MARSIYTGPAVVGHEFKHVNRTYRITKVGRTYVVCRSAPNLKFVFARPEAV